MNCKSQRYYATVNNVISIVRVGTVLHVCSSERCPIHVQKHPTQSQCAQT